MALFPKARSYGRALLLHHGSFVGDGFGGAHIADELLYYRQAYQKLIVLV